MDYYGTYEINDGGELGRMETKRWYIRHLMYQISDCSRTELVAFVLSVKAEIQRQKGKYSVGPGLARPLGEWPKSESEETRTRTQACSHRHPARQQ